MRARLLGATLRHIFLTRNVIAGHTRRLHHTKSELLDELVNRGLVDQITRWVTNNPIFSADPQTFSSPDALRQHLRSPQTVYSGIDPTSNALHVGHLIPMMVLLHFHLRGHHVIPLVRIFRLRRKQFDRRGFHLP